jgi:hypothetical protein
MKKSIHLSTGLALLTFAALQTAEAQTIAQWTFETSIPLTAGPVAPETGSGSALGSHAGAAVYSSPAGNGSAHSFSANVWAVGDYWQFQSSTIGFSGIKLTWDQTSSSTGPGRFDLQYSTDGSTFTTFASSLVIQSNAAPNPTWNGTTSSSLYSYSSDLSSVTALNNAANVYFRLLDSSTLTAGGGLAATGGTDRVDNFTIAVVPEPATGLVLLGGLGILGLCFKNRRK